VARLHAVRNARRATATGDDIVADLNDNMSRRQVRDRLPRDAELRCQPVSAIVNVFVLGHHLPRSPGLSRCRSSAAGTTTRRSAASSFDQTRQPFGVRSCVVHRGVVQVDSRTRKVGNHDAEEPESIAERTDVVTRAVPGAAAERVRVELQQIVHAMAMAEAVELTPGNAVTLLVPTWGAVGVRMQHGGNDRVSFRRGKTRSYRDVLHPGGTCLLKPPAQQAKERLLKMYRRIGGQTWVEVLMLDPR